MDFWLYFWIAIMGIVPPAITSFITSAVVGYLLYLYGKKQGEKSKEIVTKEIKTYIKGEFLEDLTAAVRDQLNGILGPVARAGSAEGQLAAAEYAKNNPSIAALLAQVAGRGAAGWLGKKFGVPKEVVNAIANPASLHLFGPPRQKKDGDLQPVQLPGPPQ